MAPPLLQLPTEIIHAILAHVDIYTLARWLSVARFILKEEEYSQHTGPIDPCLVVLYKGKLFPPCDTIWRSLFVYVSGSIPPCTRILSSVIVSLKERDLPALHDVNVSGCVLVWP